MTTYLEIYPDHVCDVLCRPPMHVVLQAFSCTAANPAADPEFARKQIQWDLNREARELGFDSAPWVGEFIRDDRPEHVAMAVKCFRECGRPITNLVCYLVPIEASR